MPIKKCHPNIHIQTIYQKENRMYKPRTTALLLFSLLPLVAQANQEGIWVTTTKPGFLFSVVEGDVNSQETATWTVYPPNGGTWQMYFGPDTFNVSNFTNTVELRPLVSSSDMEATWTATTTTATLLVKSCTTNCLWPQGTEVPFAKAYGEGVNLGPSDPPPDRPDGPGSDIAGTWAGRGTNSDGSTFEACLYVSPDQSRLAVAGSPCDEGESSVDIEIDDARETDGDDCDVNIGYPNDIPINNGRFSVEWRPPFAPVTLILAGTFSGKTVSGTLRSVTDFGDTCQGNWSASRRSR